MLKSYKVDGIGWVGLAEYGNLCKHLFQEHRSEVLLTDFDAAFIIYYHNEQI